MAPLGGGGGGGGRSREEVLERLRKIEDEEENEHPPTSPSDGATTTTPGPDGFDRRKRRGADGNLVGINQGFFMKNKRVFIFVCCCFV